MMILAISGAGIIGAAFVLVISVFFQEQEPIPVVQTGWPAAAVSIAAILGPILMLLVTGMVARLTKGQKQIHALVNSQLTYQRELAAYWEKVARHALSKGLVIEGLPPLPIPPAPGQPDA